MKKISLKNLNLKEVEQLSREQLKSVLGGFTGGTGGTDDGTETQTRAQVCYCGPNGDCEVIGSTSRTCTEICEGFEDCEDD